MIRRPIEFPSTPWTPPGTQYWIGGTMFGLGWGLLGACPGPLYVLIGNGLSVMVAALVFALLGAWTYGASDTSFPTPEEPLHWRRHCYDSG